MNLFEFGITSKSIVLDSKKSFLMRELKEILEKFVKLPFLISVIKKNF